MKVILSIMSIVAVYLSVNVFTTSTDPFVVAQEKIAAVEAAVAPVAASPSFARGNTKSEPIHWTKNPCRDGRSGAFYESDIISREEIEHNLRLAGFTGEQVRVMQAISKAESSWQINCFGDESLASSKWDVSYGLFQIRGLVSDRGRGSCRDIERLRLNILEQSKCAYEISGGGKNFRPWSVYLNGRYRKWL